MKQKDDQGSEKRNTLQGGGESGDFLFGGEVREPIEGGGAQECATRFLLRDA